jgi:hypothetical protein
MCPRSVALQGNASSEHPVSRVTNLEMDTLYLGGNNMSNVLERCVSLATLDALVMRTAALLARAVGFQRPYR